MSIRLRLSIKKTSRGGLTMKTRGFIIGAFALVLVLVATGANAYKGATPSVADFSWVNNIGTLTWGSDGTEISIAVMVSAPDGDNTNFPPGAYGSYFPGDTNLYRPFNASYDTVPDSSDPISQTFNDGTGYDPTAGSTFDSMYGYFYTITLGDSYSGNLDSFGFNMGPATITEIGYDEAYAPLAAWEIASDNTLKFIFPNFGDAIFTTGETASVYVASEYWWGWSNAIFEDNVQTSGGAYNGKLPAPNPEAPTVALFMLGIFGAPRVEKQGAKVYG